MNSTCRNCLCFPKQIHSSGRKTWWRLYSSDYHTSCYVGLKSDKVKEISYASCMTVAQKQCLMISFGFLFIDLEISMSEIAWVRQRINNVFFMCVYIFVCFQTVLAKDQPLYLPFLFFVQPSRKRLNAKELPFLTLNIVLDVSLQIY